MGYFCVVGLDRYLRVFTIKGNKPLFNTYLKSRLSGVLVLPSFDPNADTSKVPKISLTNNSCTLLATQVDSGVEANEHDDSDDDITILEDDYEDTADNSSISGVASPPP